MKHSDSSIWKSLAVAFGDGLAFGVGVKIAQASGRTRAAIPAAEPQPAREPGPAEPPEPIDLQVLSKVLAAIDARLVQSESRIAADLKAVETRQVEHDAASQAALEEIHESMMQRVDAVERDGRTVEERLAAAIGTAVEARVRQYVDARAQAIEERLQRDIGEAGDRTAKLLVETIDARLIGRVESLEAEARSQKETIRCLREAAGGSQKKLHEALEGIGRACHAAIEELKKPEGSGEDAPEPAAPPAEAVAESEDRRFDSLKLINPARPERKLPIPLVSSIAVFLLGMAAIGSHAIGF